MSIDRLIQDGSIHPFKANRKEIDRSMEIARRDLKNGERILPESLDWAYSITYNAVLQASHAFMLHRGYRASSAEKHKATLSFMKASVDISLQETIDYFDRVRKKRHRVVYDEIGLISEKEAQQLIQKAKEFIYWVETEIKTN